MHPFTKYKILRSRNKNCEAKINVKKDKKDYSFLSFPSNSIILSSFCTIRSDLLGCLVTSERIRKNTPENNSNIKIRKTKWNN